MEKCINYEICNWQTSFICFSSLFDLQNRVKITVLYNVMHQPPNMRVICWSLPSGSSTDNTDRQTDEELIPYVSACLCRNYFFVQSDYDDNKNGVIVPPKFLIKKKLKSYKYKINAYLKLPKNNCLIFLFICKQEQLTFFNPLSIKVSFIIVSKFVKLPIKQMALCTKINSVNNGHGSDTYIPEIILYNTLTAKGGNPENTVCKKYSECQLLCWHISYYLVEVKVDEWSKFLNGSSHEFVTATVL